MGFSITNLKKLIYSKLSEDTALIALLGGTANIFHFHPKQEDNITYPIVVYNIIAIEDNVYNTDRNADINNLTLNIDVFSSNSTMTEADGIADRIYTLLQGQNLSDDNIIVYSCYRNYQDEEYIDNAQCWRINARFNITNSGK